MVDASTYSLLIFIVMLSISFKLTFVVTNGVCIQWEIKGHSCFMKNRAFLIIRLTSGYACYAITCNTAVFKPAICYLSFVAHEKSIMF